MQLSSCCTIIISGSSSKLFISPKKPKQRRLYCLALSNSAESNSLESETLKTLEWSSVCKQVSAFTSTTMGSSVARAALLPVGRTPQESQKLLDQTTAARLVAQTPDFSGIEDVTEVVAVAGSGHLLTIRELCTVRRTLRAGRELFQNLKQLASDSKHPESAHISRICKILEVASKESLVLIDEIGGGTDPSEGVALSTSILQYLKDHVNLAVVTTHYADLSSMKEKDTCFDNAAMEFSLKTLQPTYRILWGSTGDSNALSIAQSIGFDRNIIDRAQKWVEKLKPEQQQERRGMLYKSLQEERNRLKAQAERAASIHAEIMNIYYEIQGEAEDLDRREMELMTKETQLVQQELMDARSQMETLIQKFEKQLRISGRDQLSSLIRESESAIASIVKAHTPADNFVLNEADHASYTPQYGEQVRVKGLGGKLATVVESPGDDTIMVQYGKVKVRVKKSSIRPIPSSGKNVVTSSSTRQRRQNLQNGENRGNLETNNNEELSYGPVVRTSKNTVDLRGMRVEEASIHLEMAINESRPYSVLFIIHGMGTGAIKERALEILQNHLRVTNYEPENPMNYGCTIAYVK